MCVSEIFFLSVVMAVCASVDNHYFKIWGFFVCGVYVCVCTIWENVKNFFPHCDRCLEEQTSQKFKYSVKTESH